MDPNMEIGHIFKAFEKKALDSKADNANIYSGNVPNFFQRIFSLQFFAFDKKR